MNTSDLISVVVPTYNRADIVLGALESVFEQTYRPIELLIVDDGSSDHTEDVVSQWRLRHNQPPDFEVRYVYQKNQGANAARNRGIKESNGVYIAFLDSDDRWLPQKLQKQISIFYSDPDVGGVYCGLRYVDLETGKPAPKKPRAYPRGNLLSELIVHDVTEGEPCWIFRRECLDKIGMFDESLPARQDWDLTIRLSAEYKIGCVPDVLVIAGNHSGERIRSDPWREIKAHKKIYHKYKHLRNRFPIPVRLAALSAMYRRRGRVYFHHDISTRKAFLLQLMAILVWPFCFDSYAALVGILLPKRMREKIHVSWNCVFGDTKIAIRSH